MFLMISTSVAWTRVGALLSLWLWKQDPGGDQLDWHSLNWH